MADQKASDCLREAKARISDPARWCQGADARSAKGRQVSADSPRAVRWCAMGALQYRQGPPIGYLLQIATTMFGDNVVHINDGRGHVAVMRLYSEAIKLAEEDEAAAAAATGGQGGDGSDGQ